jgi:putative oxidoreductase
MMNSSNNVVSLAGRILLSAIFIFAGIGKISAFSGTVGYAASVHMPMPSVAIAVALVVELLGGLAILVGFQTRIAAWIVFLYLIPASFFFHNFWAMEGAARMNNQIHFLKNVAIMGGLLILAASGAGGMSVDASRARKA